MKFMRLLITFGVAAFLYSPSASLADGDLLFHITDFGINQHLSSRMKVGDPFSEKHNRVFPDLNGTKGAQLLIPMPPDRDLDSMSEAQLADQIAGRLIERVQQARAKGIGEFEIQLIQNINTKGYFDSFSRQPRVEKFEAAAYKAIGTLIAHQQPSAGEIKVDITAGSNGTVGFVSSVDSWSSYRDHVTSVTLVDGRALLDPARKAIHAIGAHKVWISNTHGDWFAHDWSIAKLETTQKLLQEFPKLTAVLLDPEERQMGKGTKQIDAHVRLMASSDAKFMVRRVAPDGITDVGRASSREILTSARLWAPPAVAPIARESAQSSNLSKDQLQNALQNARLAESVYDLSKKQIEGRWRQIKSQADPDGFKAAVYERQLPDGRRELRIAFAGSDDRQDWLNNILQGSPILMEVHDRIEEQQYARAQAFAAGYVHLAKNDKTIANIELVGHSRAGGLVQVVSGILDVAGTAFNSAAILKMRDVLTPAQVETANRRVTQFHKTGDLVFPVTASMPDAIQLGTIYRVESRTDLIEGPIAAHGMGTMSRALGSENPQISRRVFVSQEDTEIIVRNLATIGTALDELSRFAAIKHIVRPESGGSVPLHLELTRAASRELKSLSIATEVGGIIDSIRADQKEFQGRPFVLMQSRTFELLAQTALQGTSIPGLRDLPGASGLVHALAEKLEARGIVHPQPRVSLSRDKIEIGTPTFGLIDLARAAATHAGRGRADIDTIETYLDGVVGLTWGVMGFLVSEGNLRTAEKFQDYGQALAQSGRLLLKESGGDRVLFRLGENVAGLWDRDFRNNAQVMTGMYRFAVDRAGRTGTAVPSPTEFFGGKGSDAPKRMDEMFRDGMFSGADRKELDKIYTDAPGAAPVPVKHYTLGVGDRPRSQISQDIRLASELARPEGKAVIFGSGPLADQVNQDIAVKLGRDNVKHVPVALSSYERNRIASDFGADTVIRVRQEAFREVTHAGYHFREELPDPRKRGPRRIPDPAPPDNLGKYLPPIFRRPGPPGVPIGDPPDPPKRMGAAMPPSPPVLPRFESFPSPRIGGVMLRGVAEVAGEDSPLARGNFSLVFQGSDGAIDISMLRRFVTALWATYFTTEGPGISIDPVGNMTNRQAVRYIGRVINSDLGRVMRETDYIMKSWAVGTSRPDLEDWLTPEQIGIRDNAVHVGAASRFWFVPQDMRFRQAGNTLLFDAGAIAVKTEYLFGKKGDKNPENEKWAEQFTRRYAEVAQRYPVFEELFEYAKLVSLTKYLKERGIPLLWFLLANREMVLTENSPGTVKAFVKKSDYFEELQIVGGVDLSPRVEPGSFVLDAELLKAIVEARKDPPDTQPAAPSDPFNRVELVEHGNEALTVTPSQTIVISDSRSGGESFATDLGLRLNGTPHLEIARYRRSDFPQVHTFGRDWHLMIPYAIKAGSRRGVPSPLGLLPEKVALRNLLTGVEETLLYGNELRTGTNRVPIIGFYPKTPDINLNIGLFPLTDRTYRLSDKLGCEYDFDSQGRLTRMLLAEHLDYQTNTSGRISAVTRAKDYEVTYQYSQKRLNWRDYDVLPFRLAPEGTDTISVRGLSRPSRLRLFDAATGNEEVFNFDDQNVVGLAGYFPAKTNRSGYTFLALTTDGFQLEHKSGTQITFDRSGQFRTLVVDILDQLVQDPYEVRFEYGIARGQYRIVTAHVFERKSDAAIYAVVYKYGRDGNLIGTSIASSR
jgi:hypothetical protein